MSYEVIMTMIAVLFVVASMLLVPWLKNKGLWTAALFGVNIIEQICNFLELQGYGPKKYEFVKKILLMLNPKLAEQQIETIIETLVDKMNQLGGKENANR